ncbi:ABC transporter ATP-binding protein [Desulfothermus okinawensis JCM 13304]
MTLLKTERLQKNFGGVFAVNNVSLEIKKGEILGMIGPNGSGKSTFINVITGIYEPDGGDVLFNGESISGLPPYKITEKGITRTFQNLRVFSNISVLDNILIGQHCRIKNSLIDIYLRPFKTRKREKEAVDKALEILEMVKLAHRKDELAKNLPYGEQRLIEICRALASEPELIFLDEPCAGMNPVEMDTLAEFILQLQSKGYTLFIIEHNMRFIMSVAERIVVLNAGSKFREGSPAEIQADKDVQKIYLGEEEGSIC